LPFHLCARSAGHSAAASASCVVDDSAPESLALVDDMSLSGARVVQEPDGLEAVCGEPLMVVSENGADLTSASILRGSRERRVQWHCIEPCRPTRPVRWSASRSRGLKGVPADELHLRTWQNVPRRHDRAARPRQTCAFSGSARGKPVARATAIPRSSLWQIASAKGP
jgi:hypothetical protein